MRFASKKDAWLILLGVLATVVVVLFLLPLALSSMTWTIKLPLLGLLSILIVLVPWVLWGTYYVVKEGTLNVRSGPFRWRINIADIHRVRSSRSPLSSPALSLDRLRIEYGESRHILVSPEDQEAFIKALGRAVDRSTKLELC